MDGSHLQVVQFLVGKEEYAISINQVQEIMRVPRITNLPRTEDFVLGITNIRGTVISVLDLKRFLLDQASELTENSRILVVDANHQKVALLIDEVSEVLTLSTELMVEPEQISMGINQDFLLGVARLEEKIVILLDVDHICGLH